MAAKNRTGAIRAVDADETVEGVQVPVEPAEETTAWLRARGARGWQRPRAARPAATADDPGRLG